MLRQQADHRHQEAWRAEAALQAVALVKRLLHRVEGRARPCQAFDRRHLMALGLDGQHQARPHRRAVKKDRAAPAYPVLATDVGAGQAEIVTEVVREKPARIAGRRMHHAVDLHAANAFSVNTRTR
jgi:inactivated superfamily I helicase